MTQGYLKKLEWCPLGNRPRNTWMQEVTTGMREKVIMDRQRRLEKGNKTLGTERRENIKILYINKYSV